MQGALFIEYFKRRNAELAFKWNVQSFEQHEPDLPAYVKRKEELEALLKNRTPLTKYLYSYERVFKQIFSFLVLFFMVRSQSLMTLSAQIFDLIHSFFNFKDKRFTPTTGRSHSVSCLHQSKLQRQPCYDTAFRRR